MNCPACHETLLMTDRQGIEIDYCPKCRGVWLDRGELDKILERASAASEPDRPDGGYQQRPDYRREHYDHDDDRYKYDRRHPHHKKKSFWREIFDFD